MPTYEYECDECGYGFEALQSMLEKKLKECPECKMDALHRLIGSGSGIIFKGTGFYETDYKKKESDKPKSTSKKVATTKKAQSKKKKVKKSDVAESSG